MEEEVAILTIQERAKKNFMVTLPKKFALEFGIEDGDNIRVFIDRNTKRFIYEVMPKKK